MTGKRKLAAEKPSVAQSYQISTYKSVESVKVFAYPLVKNEEVDS